MYKKFVAVLLSAIVIITILGIIILVIFNFPSRNKGASEQNQGQVENYIKGSPDVVSKENKSYTVSQLIPKLPYTGKFFSFYYNFATNQFISRMNPSSRTQGNTEFDNFLKQNGVLDRSWIENLIVVSN